MTTLQIKNKLISKIKSTEDKAILEVVYKMLDFDPDTKSKPLKLSAGQKASIAKGQKDVREGRVLSDKQVNSEMKKWLGK